MNEEELKQEERRRPWLRNVVMGVGVMLIGLLMMAGMSHRGHRGGSHFAHAASNANAESSRCGRHMSRRNHDNHSESDANSNSSMSPAHEEWLENKGRPRIFHSYEFSPLHSALHVVPRIMGLGLLVGGLTLFWRNRNPDRAYSHNSVQQHMRQEFDDEDDSAEKSP